MVFITAEKGRTMRRFFALLFFIAGSVAAADTTYVIHDIQVDSFTNVPPALIVAETRLVAGRSYTDAQLAQAINRVRRLPFVLGAQGKVMPRPEDGTFDYVIEVRDVSRVTFAFDGRADSSDLVANNSSLTSQAGGHWFSHGTNVIDADLGGHIDRGRLNNVLDLSLSYSSYALFGTHAAASVTIFRRIIHSGHDKQGLPGLSMKFVLPLTLTQSLTFSGSTLDQKAHFDKLGQHVTLPRNARSADLVWSDLRTNDPYFPRRGFDIEVGPHWSTEDNGDVLVFGRPPVLHVDQNTLHMTEIVASAARYWPTRTQTAYLVRLDANATQRDFDVPGGRTNRSHEYNAILAFGWAHNSTPDDGVFLARSRWEVGASLRNFHNAGQNTTELSFTRPGVFAGWTFRPVGGLVRLTASYYLK